MVEPVLAGNFRNFGELFRAVSEGYGDAEAIIDGQVRLTYGQWWRRGAGLATVLRQRGIGRGDVVCLMLPSSVDYAICYAAVQLLGAVVTGVGSRLGPIEVDAIMSRCTPAAVIGSGSARPSVRRGYEGVLIGYEELAACYAGPPLDAPTDVAADSPAVIVWTSGTTGLPKGAWFDHAAMSAGVRASGLLSAPFDRRVMPSPMAHAAFMTRVWDQLAYVITAVLTPTPWTAAEMLEILVRERITVGQGVPTQWEKLRELPEFAIADLSSLRIVGTGASRVPRELVRALRGRLSCPVVVRYAATETPAISGTRPGDPVDVLEGTVGRGQDGVRLRVLDDDLVDLPAGEVGRVAVHSGFRMRGYWNDPAESAAALTPDGWFISSDLGRIDGDGNLVLAGRVSDVYIRGGYNIHPLEIENVLASHPAVSNAAVIGIPAPVIGEVGVAFVSLRPGCDSTADELRAWCAKQIADYKVPDRIEFLDQLPVNAMMKVDKVQLRLLDERLSRQT